MTPLAQTFAKVTGGGNPNLYFTSANCSGTPYTAIAGGFYPPTLSIGGVLYYQPGPPTPRDIDSYPCCGPLFAVHRAGIPATADVHSRDLRPDAVRAAVSRRIVDDEAADG